MSASFTPDFKGYTGQGAFRFWCQTALPLIYDDSLSYYELLNKMVVYLNNVISDVGNMEDNVNALLSAYNQLQDYVNTYFDNLDVQEEINHKLDEMAEGGTLSSLIAPFVADGLPSVVEAQIDAVVADQIDGSVGSQIDASVASQIATPVATNVTSWLNENVTPVGSAVVVDTSLSVSGAAADAKVTGDKITELQSALGQLSFIKDATYGKGTFTSLNCDENYEMSITSANNRVYIGPFKLYDDVIVRCDNDIKFEVYTYYTYNNTSKYTQWHSDLGQQSQIIGYNPSFADSMYYYLLLAYEDDASITNPEDVICKLGIISGAGRNPLHLIAAGGWNNNNGVVTPLNISINTKNRVMGMFETADAVVCSAEATFSMIKSGVNYELTSVTVSPPVNGTLNTLFVNITMPNYSSFEDMYEDIGFSTKLYNTKTFIGELGRIGQPNGKSYNVSTYEFASFTDSQNRCLFGPFKAHKDLLIKASTSGVFILYALYLSTEQVQTAYNQVTSTWKSGNLIIPVNPLYADNVYYYLMVRKTDDKRFLSIAEAESVFTIEELDNVNPLGVMFASGWDNDSAPVGHNTSQLFRALFRQYIDTTKYYYTGSDSVLSIRQNGTEKYSNVSGGVVLEEGTTDFLVRTKDSGNMFELFSSFDEMNDYIRTAFETINIGEITGSYAFNDPVTYLPNSITKGQAFSESMANGTVIEGTGIGLSHTPRLCINNGYGYLVFQANANEIETDETTSVYLAKINLDTKAYTITKIAGVGTYGGVTFDGACTNPTAKIVSGTLYVLFNSHVSDEVALCCCAYDLSDDTFASQICNITIDETNYSFTVSNFNDKFGFKVGMMNMKQEIVISVPQFDGNETYYSGLSSGAWKHGKTAIIETQDFITWSVFSVLPAKYGSDSETVIYLKDGYFYGASRHYFSYATLAIWKMNKTTKRIVDFVQIPDAAVRPTFYEKNGVLYLIHGLSGRYTIQIVRINTNFLSQSYDVITAYIQSYFGYNSFADDATSVYVASQIRTGGHYRVRLNTVTFDVT